MQDDDDDGWVSVIGASAINNLTSTAKSASAAKASAESSKAFSSCCCMGAVCVFVCVFVYVCDGGGVDEALRNLFDEGGAREKEESLERSRKKNVPSLGWSGERALCVCRW